MDGEFFNYLGIIFQFFNLSFHANKCMATSKRNSRIQQIGDHHYYHHRIMWVGGVGTYLRRSQ
jgi:hypothetical protein